MTNETTIKNDTAINNNLDNMLSDVTHISDPDTAQDVLDTDIVSYNRLDDGKILDLVKKAVLVLKSKQKVFYTRGPAEVIETDYSRLKIDQYIVGENNGTFKPEEDRIYIVKVPGIRELIQSKREKAGNTWEYKMEDVCNKYEQPITRLSLNNIDTRGINFTNEMLGLRETDIIKQSYTTHVELILTTDAAGAEIAKERIYKILRERKQQYHHKTP